MHWSIAKLVLPFSRLTSRCILNTVSISLIPVETMSGTFKFSNEYVGIFSHLNLFYIFFLSKHLHEVPVVVISRPDLDDLRLRLEENPGKLFNWKTTFPLKYLFCAPRRLTVHSRGEERHSNFLAFSSDERKVLVWQLQIGLEWELPFWLYGWKSCFSSSINSNNNINTTTTAIILAKIWMAINSSSYSSKSSSNNNNSSSVAKTAAATPAPEQLTSAIAATTASAIKAAATTNNICSSISTSNYVVKYCLSANLVFPIRLSPAVGSVVGGIQSSLCEPE